MTTVPVALSSGTYDVHIGRGLLGEAGRRVRAIAPARKAVVVADENVSAHAATLTEGLRAADFEVVAVTLHGGESAKRLEPLVPIFEQVLAAGIDRRTPVLGVGGGVTTDVAGFLAATLLRGVPFLPVPTSLLAMVDASVGGKTGVNAAVGKNLIGCFHQPAAVLIDVNTLATLPPRELRCGLAECIKHAVIRDATLFEKLERDVENALRPDLAWLAEHVAANVRIKAAVVEQDPHEHGVRAHLNLGHTFAHAIEKVTDHATPHGEAVAVGLCAAATLAADLGTMTTTEARRVRELVARAGLPTSTKADPAALLDAMRFDKKVRDGVLRLVVPVGLGAAEVREDVPTKTVETAWKSVSGKRAG